jgi:hypothetical protein
MGTAHTLRLRGMEGTRVTVELIDGSRIEGGRLVSDGRACVGRLWLRVMGEDLFVARGEVVDVWPAEQPLFLAA